MGVSKWKPLWTCSMAEQAEGGSDEEEIGLSFAKEHMSLSQGIPEWGKCNDLTFK